MNPIDIVVAPIALFAWLLQTAAPLPAGPGLSPSSPTSSSAPQPTSTPTSTSIYNDRGKRLGYTVTHPDGSVDFYHSDSSRLGYSTPGRIVITPHR